MDPEDSSSSSADESPYLSTVQGELSFFRSIMRARPVGIHRHFHVLSIRNAIQKDTGHLVPIEEIWDKLQSCYDLDALEGLELEGYDSPSSNDSTAPSVPSPSPSQNLFSHPHFRDEYSLPSEDFYTALISIRRMRDSASVASSSPEPPPKRRKGADKVDMAGLVGGDSDSSALTQESGDEEGEEEAPASPGEKVVAGTDEDIEAEDVDMQDPSPAPSLTIPRPPRGRGARAAKTTGPMTRTRAAARLTKRRKRS